MTGRLQSALQAGGTLDPELHLYIERTEDALLLELLDRGEYCNILSSRQVGKSSLMMHARVALMARGKKVVVVDLAGQLGSPDAADEWYCGLLGEIVRQLDLDVDVSDWWSASREATANQRLLQFFRSVLLPRLNAGLVVFLDEIDHTLKFDYTDDFFTAIRSMYNDRPLEPMFRRITFCLAGVATPNELIKNRRTTAYNVGKTIEITDFDIERYDMSPLIQTMSPDPREGERIVRAVLGWTGGHPFLTIRLCEQFLDRKGGSATVVDTLVEETYQDLEHLGGVDVHFEAITRFIEERLADGPATLELYERILRGKPEPDKPTIYHTQLKLSGLVKRDSRGHLIIRNRIYAKIFDLAWVQRSQPLRTALRYQRAAIAASVLLIAGSAAAATYYQIIAPPRQDAARALAEIRATLDERVARDRYDLLTGRQMPFGFAWTMAGFRTDAESAFRDFWERRAATLETRALDRLKTGAVEEACVLGAAAAVKRDGRLHPDIQKAFDEQGLSLLQTSVLGLPKSIRGFLATFANDGKHLLIAPEAVASQTPSALRIVDVESGAMTWSADTPHMSLLLSDGSGFLELVSDQIVRVRSIPGGEVIADVTMPVNVRVPLWLLSASGFPGGQDREAPGPRGAARLLQQASACLTRLNPDAVYALDFSPDGRMAAVVQQGRVAICDLQHGEVTRRLAARTDVATQSERPLPVFFSPDSRFLALEILGPPEKPSQQITIQGRRGVVWDASTGGEVAAFQGGPRVFTRDMSKLLIGRANTTRILSSADWREIASIPLRLEAAFPQVASPDGRMVVGSSTATDRYDLEVWDLAEKVKLAAFASETLPLALFSPDSQRIAISGERVRVWNVASLVKRPSIPSRPSSHDPRAEQAYKAPAPRPAPPTPAERWRRWQTKFGLTLSDTDDTVPIWSNGLRSIDGIKGATN